MTRKQLILELKKYFDVRELVCECVFKAFGEKAWQFFDQQALESLLILRTQVHKKGMTINNWKDGGPLSQRGLRCNICKICKDKTLLNELYMSAHANGAAFDYDVTKQTAEESRQQVIQCAYMFTNRIRLEGKVTWVHFDVYDDPNSTDKIITF